MDEVLGDDLPLAAARLFDRLSQIPNYTWDKSVSKRSPFNDIAVQSTDLN